MADTARILQRLGFGEYEARAYIAILQRSLVTGYELAKLSGIPRANVYEVLPRLEERGAVVRVDSPVGARYSAVPPSELLSRLADRYNDDLARAEEALASAGSAPDQDYAWNIEGLRSAVDHARTLIDAAETSLQIALWPQESGMLASSLSEAEGRGARVTTLCLAACAQECGACRGSIYRYRLSPEASRWLIVVADDQEMLAAEIGSSDTASAVRTTQQLLVELAAWYIRNSLALATIVTDLGERLPELLSPEAAAALSSLGRSDMAGGWLEQMRQALARSGAL